MAFYQSQYNQLIDLKFVGTKIIECLEQMGLDSFDKLKQTTLDEILSRGARLSGSTCWENSH